MPRNLKSSIIPEAKANSKLSVDIDNFRERYLDIDYDNNLSVTIPSFDIDTFDKEYFLLLDNSDKKEFINRWIQRPDYVSYDSYSTVVLWPLIMYVNNVYCIEEFKGFSYIYVPSYNSVLNLVKNRILDNTPIRIEDMSSIPALINNYYKKYPLDNLENERRKAAIALSDSTNTQSLGIYTTTKTDIFTLTSTNITNQYIDLSYQPDNISSIVLNINDYPVSQKYNYDYTLIYNGNNELKRISWKNSDIIENNTDIVLPANMSSYLEVDDVIKVNYTTSVTYKLADGTPSI